MLSAEPSFDGKEIIIAESCFLFPVYAFISGSYYILYSVFTHGRIFFPFPDNRQTIVFES